MSEDQAWRAIDDQRERLCALLYRMWPRSRFAGYRLTATDTTWSVGEGEPVRAPMATILLLLTGRTPLTSILPAP